MTILVTGGAGFIGSNFVLDWLARSDEAVVNVDKLTYAGNPDNLRSLDGDRRHVFRQLDICDADALERLFSEFDFRAVVHFAAESHVDRSIHGPEAFLETNVTGTFRLLEAARRHWLRPGADADGRRFIHVSTDEVYGSLAPDDPAFTEDSVYRPNSPYSASKAASDHFARAYHHTYGLPVITTNCSNNYGPYQFPEKLIPLVIHNAVNGLTLPVYGDGLQVRDWLYVGDHCAAVRAVLARGRPGATYNIGGRCEMANIEVVHAICDGLDRRRPRNDGASYREQISFVADRAGHDRRYAVDCARIEAELGWKPAESFESGMARTVDWYLANGAWTDRVTSGAYQDWVRKQYR